jgi:hypothetical protein
VNIEVDELQPELTDTPTSLAGLPDYSRGDPKAKFIGRKTEVVFRKKSNRTSTELDLAIHRRAAPVVVSAPVTTTG